MKPSHWYNSLCRFSRRSTGASVNEVPLRIHRHALEKPDMALINAHDETLNAELKDVLTDQAP
jgi:hypothetical protein